MTRRLSLCVWVGAALWLCAASAGCATYTDHVREAKTSVIHGNAQDAVTELNDALGTEKDHEYPAKLTGENTLILLERATLLQALGKYKLAARDMMIADKQLDWLDIGAQGKAKIGKYMFSGASVKYRAPPFERLLLNTLNMVNFLALGDYEDAKVEARRFSIIEHFFVNDESKTLLPSLLGLGNYLGGASFEAVGDYDEAARYYAKAYQYGVRTDRFRSRLVELFRMTGYSPKGRGDEVERIARQARGGEVMSFEQYRKRYVDGEVLVLVQTGLVPYKEGKRYPVAEALAYASAHSYHYDYSLTADERNRAQELAVSGALKWISFPMLTEKGLPPDRSVNVEINGGPSPLFEGMDVERQVEHAWDRVAGALMVAAITRMITRAVAGAAAREATQAASGGETGLGMLAQLVVEGGMAAADKPDTRSWSMLPARIRFARMNLPPGRHSVRVEVNGRTLTKTVEVPEIGMKLVNFSRVR